MSLDRERLYAAAVMKDAYSAMKDLQTEYKRQLNELHYARTIDRDTRLTTDEMRSALDATPYWPGHPPKEDS
jgi:hypothetical protein